MDHNGGNIYVVNILGTLIADGGRILEISERVLGLDHRKNPSEIERIYFELLGSSVVPNPIELYGDDVRSVGTKNLSQGDYYMQLRFRAIDAIILENPEQDLLRSVEKRLDGMDFRDNGHTYSAHVRLLPKSQSEGLVPLLLDVQRSQNAIAPKLKKIEFDKLRR